MTLVRKDALDVDVDAAIEELGRVGFARLGRVLTDEGVTALGARADAIMTGEITIPGLFFQHDAESGRYEDLRLGKGYEGPSLAYRKLEKLEKDPLFWELIQNEHFERIATRAIGAEITLYRAVLFNKAPHFGSRTPWHQDAGDFWGIDRDPELQIWTALDDVTEASGCLELVPGSHVGGRVTPLGGVIDDRVVKERAPAPARITARAGESVLIHNLVWHSSGANTTASRRRALSVCYLDARTRCLRTKRAPRDFVRVFPR
jgi:phytanoyl-CoA hydroxylase